jgi:serine/threonine protein kinase/tetratricopeptide (TPR) repeat protein
MKPEHVRDPAEIFEAARQLPTARERRIYLEAVCGPDVLLRKRVEALLESADSADAFFNESASAVTEVLAGLHAEKGSGGLSEALSAFLPGEEPIGTRIGRYKLLQKIGEGGCGVVYEAEQEEPVRRRVALKIIKLGMETKSVIARFEAERQALAMMDHPNIAHVFDAGATDRGPPYFVMELVRGVKITDYCDQNRLDPRQRLDLFIQICHAIQHAHQKGVIHGDIKPSNIMVMLHDGVALPKVIDFGISKATEARLADRLLVTAAGQLVGTPAYMSPEQAEMGGIDIDTRSDIYSLGVLLYELLTGATPFSVKELGAAGFEAMRRTLREKEPPRPSARLRMLEGAEQELVAKLRRSDPDRLWTLYHGDLDWIVMKALEKDRRRRYETANGLAVDIQRHLGNEPVLARPPSRLYRFEKLVRRNRGVFFAAGAVGVSLVAGLATSTWLFIREREARQRAVAAEQQEVRLRHEAEARQKVTQVALLVSHDRFQEADTLVSTLTVNDPTVEAAAVYRALGEWHVVENRWPEAARRFAAMFRLDEIDGVDAVTLDLLRYGPAIIASGDSAGYQHFREQVIARFRVPSIVSGDRVIKICLLAPADEALRKQLEPFADSTAKALAEAEANGDVFSAAWRTMSLALWSYRNGDFETAVNRAGRCVNYTEVNAPRTATAYLILSMAERRMGRTAQADAHLREARELIDSKYKDQLTRGSPVQGFWFDWEFAHILLREAEALSRS